MRSRALPRRCCHAKAIVNAPHATDCGGTRVETNRQLLLVQGGQDRIAPPAHAHWLMRHCRRPELWLRPHGGHISILNACPLAMDWLKAHCEPRYTGMPAEARHPVR